MEGRLVPRSAMLAAVFVIVVVLVGGSVAASAIPVSPRSQQIPTPPANALVGGSRTPALVDTAPQVSPQLVSSSRTMVLDVGPPGSADSVYARSPFVLRDSDGSYKMWYSGYDGSRNRGMYATSYDGVHWTKHGVILDVLTAPYNWDSVGPMHVIKIGSTYQGWFSAGYWSGGAYGYWAQIYHATSTDGATWNVTGVALPPNQAWDLGMTNSPSVVRDAGGRYWMTYFGWNGTTTRLGIATSLNGTWFAPYAGNPILPLGPSGAWDSVDMSGSSLVLAGSSWTMWYDGWNGAAWQIGIARSPDGFNWTKDSGNPILAPEANGAWDGQSVLAPDLVASPDGLVLYYVGGDGTFQRIGLDTFAPPPGRSMVLDVGPSGSADGAWVSFPFVLRDSDGSYKMWYTGNDGSRNRILLATSQNGLTWTKVGVVLYVSDGVDSPFVMKVGSTYHMWFTLGTWCCSSIGYLDQIYHTTSTNGINWTAPVFAVGVGPAGSWNNDTVSQPWIVQDASGLYRMFYGGWNNVPMVQIGEATSTDLVTWTPYSANPVLSFGAAGSWDSGAVVTPSVVRAGNSWTLYYAGNQNGTPSRIGRAFSSDGYHWTKDASNPVIGPEAASAWDGVSVGSPDLVVLPSGPAIYYSGSGGTSPRIGLLSFTVSADRKNVLSTGPAGSPDSDAIYSASVLHNSDGTYTMVYTGLAGGTYTILRATSSDGVTFTKQGPLFASSSSDATPFLMKVGATYHLWYEVVSGCGPLGFCDQIYSATSPDGFNWTQQGLVLGLGPTGAFDAASVSDPHVVDAGNGTYRMYYTGTDTSRDAEIGIATSTNLLNWTRYARNPVVPFGAPGAWDNAHVASPSVALTGATWTMYYYAFANGSTARIGRATSPDGLTWTKDAANPLILPETGPAWDDTSVAFPDFSADGSGARLYYRGSNATTSSIGVFSFQASSPPGVLTVSATASSAFAQTGQMVLLMCSASGGTAPYTYSWAFGDGTGGSGANITHAYTYAGNYTATCAVADSASSTAFASTTITVGSTSTQPVPLVDYVSPRGYVCPVPASWTRTYNLTSGSFTYELFLQGTVDGWPANMLVDSESASGVQETSAYLNGLVSKVISGVQSSLPDAYLASSTVLTISNHLGVTFVIGYSAHPLVQYGLIVVSAANSREWNVILTGASSVVGTINATFAQVVSGFTITLQSTPPTSPAPQLGLSGSALVLGAVFAVIVAVVLAVAYLASRQPRAMIPAAPAPPMPYAGPPPALLTCPFCGASLEPGGRFCGSCGTPMMGGPPPPPPRYP